MFVQVHVYFERHNTPIDRYWEYWCNITATTHLSVYTDPASVL